MASGSERVKESGGNIPVGDESSESEGETEPAKSFHRRLSTNREIKCSASIKEGFLLKQTWSFQRWRRRYFKLKGRKLYYAKDTKGTLEDGTEFDSSYKNGQPFSFTLGSGQVIKGWDQGLLGMCVGEKRKLVIPPSLGYGSSGFPPVIPPDAVLTFEVELIDIDRKNEL